MLLKSTKTFLFILVAALSISASAMAEDLTQGQKETLESLTKISKIIGRTVNANPVLDVIVTSQHIQDILCEINKLKLSDQGKLFAGRSRLYFEKTLANLGKQRQIKFDHPCFATYPLAIYFFGQLYTTELKKPNPFKDVLWEEINRQMGFAEYAIKQFPFDASEKDKSTAFKKALNSMKVALIFPDAIVCLSEQQVKPMKNSLQRCQFAYSRKDYAGFQREMAAINKHILKLKGIAAAVDNCQ